MIDNISHLPGLGKSDHLVLYFDYYVYTKQQDATFTKKNYFKGNYSKILDQLMIVDWNQVFQRLSLAESWKVFANKIIKLVESNIPECKGPRDPTRKNPYVNNCCLTAIKQKHSKWTKYLHCKSDGNYHQYKIARNKVISELRKAKYYHEKNLAAKIKTDSKLFWAYVRSKLKTKSAIWQLESPDGLVVDGNQERANLLNKYFAGVFLKEESVPLPNFDDRNYAQELNIISVTELKISKAIDRIKPSKSSGPDNIHPKILKECNRAILKPLKIIFEKSVKECKIPDIWKSAYRNVTAIHKSGPKSKPENYRPISLTSVPGKILERLIRDELVSHMKANNLFSCSQHGFLAGRSCTTQLLEFLEDVTTALDNGEDVDVIYLDFCKAFDKVPHKRLLRKLWGYGIRGNVYAWIQDFLSDRKQHVRINGNLSDPVKVTSGVPQGSVLGPILFLIYINDLPEVISTIMKLFADDAKIYKSISTIQHIELLQLSVDEAVAWAGTWEMFFNLKKCKHLHIGTRLEPASYQMKSGQESTKIEKVASEKGLGVIVDQALNFSEHINSKVNKANRNLGMIFRTFTYMDKEIFLNLYKSVVRPHLEYAVTVCSPLYKQEAHGPHRSPELTAVNMYM